MTTSLLFALLACSTPDPAIPAPAPAAAPVEEPTAPPAAGHGHGGPDWEVKEHMDMHFAFVTDALWLMFRGDLDAMKAEAAKLSEHEPVKAAPEAWKPFLAEMYARSKSIERAESLDAAADRLVLLSDTCANCHLANNGPKVTKEDLNIAPLFTEGAAMDRHQWAIYMMWIGMVAPNDDIWVEGTKTFAHDKTDLPVIPDSVRPLENRVHDLAAKGSAAKTREERGEVFKGIITTCAECHTTLGVPIER